MRKITAVLVALCALLGLGIASPIASATPSIHPYFIPLSLQEVPGQIHEASINERCGLEIFEPNVGDFGGRRAVFGDVNVYCTLPFTGSSVNGGIRHKQGTEYVWDAGMPQTWFASTLPDGPSPTYPWMSSTTFIHYCTATNPWIYETTVRAKVLFDGIWYSLLGYDWESGLTHIQLC